MTPAAVLSRTNGRESISRGDVEEVHALFRFVPHRRPPCLPTFSAQASVMATHARLRLLYARPDWILISHLLLSAYIYSLQLDVVESGNSRCCMLSWYRALMLMCRDAKFSARVLMEQADKFIT